MEKENKFLGTGWSFPPEFDQEEGQLMLTSGREDIERSLEILIGTRKGERIMIPDYGCNLDEMTFESFNLSLKTLMTDVIETAIVYHEPRIKLESVGIDDSFISEGRLMIEVSYIIRNINSRFNKVFPFYLNEKTDQ